VVVAGPHRSHGRDLPPYDCLRGLLTPPTQKITPVFFLVCAP
jgi:hypothetical protein